MNINIISPETTDELLAMIGEYQDKKFRFGAGYTDLMVELKKQPDPGLTVINLAHLNDDKFTSIEKIEDGMKIGALVTAHLIVTNKDIENEYPVLHQAALKHGSRQIRGVATVGGNLCTASPAADMATALTALKAQCEIFSVNGKTRIIPIEKFFTGVRKTAMNKDEILRSVIIPHNGKNLKLQSDFIKIGTRRSMECAVISLAYHFQLDGDKIVRAGIAIGSAAPTIKFTSSACDYLVGKSFSKIDDSAAEEFAGKVIEYASPISDVRGSAWYREEVLRNVSRGIFVS